MLSREQLLRVNASTASEVAKLATVPDEGDTCEPTNPVMWMVFWYMLELENSSFQNHLLKNEIVRLAPLYESLAALLVRARWNESLLELSRMFLVMRDLLTVCDNSNDQYVVDKHLRQYRSTILPTMLFRLLAVGLRGMITTRDQYSAELARLSFRAIGTHYDRNGHAKDVAPGILPLVNHYLRSSVKRSNLADRIGLDEKATRLQLAMLRRLVVEAGCGGHPYLCLSTSDILYSSKVEFFEPTAPIGSRFMHETDTALPKKKVRFRYGGTPTPPVLHKYLCTELRKTAKQCGPSHFFPEFSPVKYPWIEGQRAPTSKIKVSVLPRAIAPPVEHKTSTEEVRLRYRRRQGMGGPLRSLVQKLKCQMCEDSPRKTIVMHFSGKVTCRTCGSTIYPDFRNMNDVEHARALAKAYWYQTGVKDFGCAP